MREYGCVIHVICRGLIPRITMGRQTRFLSRVPYNFVTALVISLETKVARRLWAPRTFLEITIKSGYVLENKFAVLEYFPGSLEQLWNCSLLQLNTHCYSAMFVWKNVLHHYI